MGPGPGGPLAGPLRSYYLFSGSSLSTFHKKGLPNDSESPLELEESSLFRSRFALLLRSCRSQGQIVWVDCRTRRSILSARIGVSRVGPGFRGWQVPPGPGLHRIQYLQPATGRGACSFWGKLQGTRERKKETDGDGKTNIGPVSVP